jgi:primosomal protein N' (replication factor Y) (superfamily II helicase)
MEARYFYLINPLSYTGATSAFTYHSTEVLEPGTLVEIPVGRRTLTGLVQATTSLPEFPTKAVIRQLDLPSIPHDLMRLADWLAGFYVSSLSSVWNTMLPAGLAKNRRARPPAQSPHPHGLPTAPLTPEQAAALQALNNSSTTTTLIQGVTGSGKTRLYLEETSHCLASGRSVIVLVPEITLTPQMVTQFEQAFGPAVLASHSKLTEAKRYDIWQRALEATTAQEARVIIGPRSCLFMPVHQLGLVIIDECHEGTYKQERSPRYQAIPTAAWRIKQAGGRLLLGSATPGLTELNLAKQGRIGHILLSKRVNNIPHSQAKILDLRDKSLFKSNKFITQPLIEAITETMEAGRQSLLYINRRGSASSQVCSNCGQVTTCPNCSLPLTFHADLMRLICHHCNFRRPSPAVCSECNAAELRLLGGGTKRIESEIINLFPEARIARLDRDSATLSHVHHVLGQLAKGELDILIGTQMIAKGLDLPAVDTVGVIGADTMLHLPDFTAAERTFQLLSQVSGRAGRGDRPGQVFIQTYSPSHPAIQAAATGSYDEFATNELAERQALVYPPFCYLLKLTIATKTREAAVERSEILARELRRQPGVQVIGPAPSFIEYEASLYRWMITVKAIRRPVLANIATRLPDTNWTADLDPVNLL